MHKMLRNALVTCQATGGGHQALITINDDVQHTFGPRSQWSKALGVLGPQEIGERLTGGDFFTVDGQLVDFRDPSYPGFVHTDAGVDALMETLGVTRGPSPGSTPILGRSWSKNQFDIGRFAGGEFSSEIGFVWSPFHSVINTEFLILRLICSNGMMAKSSLINSRIPVINCWEEHLEIASRLMQNKVVGMIERRLRSMVHERATVDELIQTFNHARGRLTQEALATLTMEQFVRLRNISKAANPAVHLGDVYGDDVFSNTALARQVPGHLTTLDVYNMITEMSTHTPETELSTRNALDRFASVLIFDRKAPKLMLHDAEPIRASFSDPRRAFFGDVA